MIGVRGRRLAAAWQAPGALLRPVLPLFFLLAVALWYLPLWPDPAVAVLDSSWKIGLLAGCDRGFAFGRDLVFTYGPYGCFASGQYWPSLYLPSLLFQAVLALLSAWLMWDAGDRGRDRLAAFVALLWLGASTDTAPLALPLSYAFHAWRRRVRSVVGALALLALAPLALVKFTLLPLCACAVAAAALLRDRAPWRDLVLDLVLFCTALALAWLAVAQPWDAFVDYLTNSAELARGYPQAMAWPGRITMVAAVGLLRSLAVAALALAMAWDLLHEPRDAGESRRQRAAWALFVIPTLWLAVRHGTTRADMPHLAIALSFTGALGLAVLGSLNVIPRRLAYIVGACALLAWSFDGDWNLMRGNGVVHRHVASLADGLAVLLRGEDPRAALAQREAQLRARLAPERKALSAIDGPYAILGQDQYLILALGVADWAPPPVLQAYSAYTPALSGLDAAYFRAPAAPAWVIARAQSIDDRLPLMDDAAIWPVLRERYEVAALTGAGLILRRKTLEAQAVAAAAPGPQMRFEVEDWTRLPAMTGDTVYAAIRLHAGLLDVLRTVAWKPPIRYLELRAQGSDDIHRFRLVPELAAAGFPLFPRVQTTEQLAAWLRGEAGSQVRDEELRVTDELGLPVAAELTVRAFAFPEP